MTKAIKFANHNDAAEMMAYAIEDGHITAWNMSASGKVRYLCAKCGLWLDLTKGAFVAWKYAY